MFQFFFAYSTKRRIYCPSLCTRPILEIVHSIKNKIAPILFLLEKNLRLSLCAQYARTKIGGILFFNLNEFEFDLTKEWIEKNLRKKDFELEHICLFARNIIENNFNSYKCIHYLSVYHRSIKGMTQYPIISNLGRRKCGIALPFAYFRHKRNKMSLSYITTIYSGHATIYI